MDRRPKALWIAPTLLVALACSPAGEQVSMSSGDVEAINQLREREAAALNAGALEDLPTVYADDVVMMPPNEPAVMGQEASQAWLAGFLETFAANVEYTGSDVTFAGDLAIERYAGTVMLTPRAGGESVTETIKGIHIYERQADGSWRIVQDIWNSDEAMPADE